MYRLYDNRRCVPNAIVPEKRLRATVRFIFNPQCKTGGVFRVGRISRCPGDEGAEVPHTAGTCVREPGLTLTPRYSYPSIVTKRPLEGIPPEGSLESKTVDHAL